MKTVFCIILSLLNISTFSQTIEIIGSPELIAPGIISIQNSEVKITFSKNGKIVLWGEIGRDNGAGGLDIWKAIKSDSGWSNPEPVSFNTPYNDFDPCFSANGKILYFFSNKPGGIGGTDIYYVDYDSIKQSFGEPVNMGSNINSPGDEWGPMESNDGKKFIFCTDSLGGLGKHDIFICEKTNNGWSKPKEVNKINSSEDDFDPIFLNDCKTIVFTRKKNEDEAYLYISFLSENGYSKPEKLKENINIPGTWNFGSSPDPQNPSCFYYSTHIENNSKGELDIYRVRFILKNKN